MPTTWRPASTASTTHRSQLRIRTSHFDRSRRRHRAADPRGRVPFDRRTVWSAIGGGDTVVAALGWARECCPDDTRWELLGWEDLYGD